MTADPVGRGHGTCYLSHRPLAPLVGRDGVHSIFGHGRLAFHNADSYEAKRSGTIARATRGRREWEVRST